MKAALYIRYGPPEVVQITDVDKPAPKGNEVLLRVRAASVNPYDWHFMRGDPYLLRLMAGLSRPKDQRLGSDVAGQVESVGSNVTQFKPGDEVFGSCRGAFAEYACAEESKLIAKPASVTFAQAASVPIAAFTALQSLRLGGLTGNGSNQLSRKVLINGAAGGVGTFAVQIARSFGAQVTAVCSTRNAEMVRSIGADRVVDYTQQDFTQTTERYDVFLDNVGNRSLSACRRLLNSNGTYIAAGGSTDPWMIRPLARMVTQLVLSRLGSQKLVGIFAKASQDDLAIMCDLMKAGKVIPVLDQTYTFSELREAIRYLETGHARGKVVITFD
jgi:NADPH:quinone reductase-like Zn-dependent oxidoreductase